MRPLDNPFITFPLLILVCYWMLEIRVETKHAIYSKGEWGVTLKRTIK